MILVTGASGQLGSELKALLQNDALYTDCEDLDIVDYNQVEKYIHNHDIDLIINCAAYTAVDKAEDDEALCFAINSTGPKNLSQFNIPIIHISTDYVFGGDHCIPYCEDDIPCPTSVYGKSKLEGENAIRANACSYAIIRTSWLYSNHHPSFYGTMTRLGKEKDQLGIVADQVGTPTRTADLAQVIAMLVPMVQKGMKETFHFSNEGVCSWYDFAHAIMQLKNLKCKVYPINSSEFPTKAKRPAFSVLSKKKIKQALGIDIAHWRDALKEEVKDG